MSISSHIKTAKNKSVRVEVPRALRLLASPNRFNLIRLLFAQDNRDICVKEIAGAIGMSQSATSHQLALLEAQGVVRGVRYGQTTCYYLTDTKTSRLIKKLIKSIK